MTRPPAPAPHHRGSLFVTGLAPGASPADIKRAYRAGRRYHPGSIRAIAPRSRYGRISGGTQTLVDPDRRRAYDSTARRCRRTTSTFEFRLIFRPARRTGGDHAELFPTCTAPDAEGGRPAGRGHPRRRDGIVRRRHARRRTADRRHAPDVCGPAADWDRPRRNRRAAPAPARSAGRAVTVFTKAARRATARAASEPYAARCAATGRRKGPSGSRGRAGGRRRRSASARSGSRTRGTARRPHRRLVRHRARAAAPALPAPGRRPVRGSADRRTRGRARHAPRRAVARRTGEAEDSSGHAAGAAVPVARPRRPDGERRTRRPADRRESSCRRWWTNAAKT